MPHSLAAPLIGPIADQISRAIGQPFQPQRSWGVGGGSINQCHGISDDTHTYFVKLNQASRLGMFESEALGLKDLAAANSLRIPQVLGWGLAEQHSFLVLEWLDFGRGQTPQWQTLGQQLARLHRQSIGSRYGWHQQNTIGSTPQPNPWTETWLGFWQQHRLGYQLQLARRRGGDFPQQAALEANLPRLLGNHHPQPSLVHGDLWGGNAGFTVAGEPIIFDPAVYYGDREVDLAMTELFGGFPRAFYQGYQQEFPLTPGYEQRKILYNLYHILNHFNLFGGSYLAQANQMIGQILLF
jgi:fructosamine-3-kinase